MNDRSTARPDTPGSSRRRISPPAATGLVLFLGLCAFVGWLWWQGEPPPPSFKPETAVAEKSAPPAAAPAPAEPAAAEPAPAETGPTPNAEPAPQPTIAATPPAPEPPTEKAFAPETKPAEPSPEPTPPQAAAPQADASPVAPPPGTPTPQAAAPEPPASAPAPSSPAPPPVAPSPQVAEAPQPAPPPTAAPTPPKPPAKKQEAPRAEAAKPAAPKAEHVGPLPPVPDPALVQSSPHGLLPIIAPDGRKPWQVYARPFDEGDTRPRIAIMVADMGLSQAATQSAITRLPSAVTLAFAPYASDLQTWIAQCRAAGHEALLQLPMEPIDYPHNDPGPRALLTSLKLADNLDRLSWLLGRFTGYVGVTNYMGSKFTASAGDVRPILEVLGQRGLLFVDSRSSARSVATRVAAEVGLPHAYNDRFLDNEASRTAIDARLEELERIALKNGVALGIGYPYPVTIDRIANWAPTLVAKGIVLAPVSAVVNKQSE